MPIGNVTLKHKRKECDVEWNIHSYLHLREVYGVDHVSPRFSFEGESWCFGLWTKGNRYAGSAGCIDLALIRCSNGPPVNMEFSFSIKSSSEQKTQTRHSTGLFDKETRHEIKHFISISDLEKRQAELLPYGNMTVVCTLNRINLTESAGCNTSTKSCFSEKNVDDEIISTHEKKCMDNSREDCSDDVLFKYSLKDHECLKKEIKKCFYCKKIVDGENTSTHEKKCMERLIKCSKCSDVILLQKWYNHECQVAGAEASEKVMLDFKTAMLSGDHSDVTTKVKKEEF